MRARKWYYMAYVSDGRCRSLYVNGLRIPRWVAFNVTGIDQDGYVWIKPGTWAVGLYCWAVDELTWLWRRFLGK